MIRKIMSYVQQYKKESIIAPVAMIGEVGMEVAIPFVMSKMIDGGINGAGGTPYIIKMGLLMTGMAVFSLLCGAMSARYAAVASTGLAANLRKGMFDKVQAFSFSNTDRFSTSSLITRLTTDVNNAQMAYQMFIRMMVRAPFMFIMALIMAISINAPLSVVFAVVIPILLLCIGFMSSRAFPYFQQMFRKYDKMNAAVQENLTGIRIVKAFVREEYEDEKFGAAAADVYETSMKAEKLTVWMMPLMQLCMYGCMIAVAWFGAGDIIAGRMLTGELMSFISYVTQILSSLMMVAMVYVMFIMSRASLTRIVEVLDEKIDITDDGADPDLEVADGSVVFDHVGFSYGGGEDGKPVLEDIELAIRSGEKIGILGGTGSAKTTLVQLIARLYDVQRGRVLVGGRDVRDYKLDTLRGAVAMVLQKNVLFSGTIAENLRWGNEHATQAELEEACRQAQAHDFIMSFPDGYETMLEQGGVNLSGGQKQRICIARALLRKPKVIILDDSTSAVDTATDSKIQQAFREHLSDTTTIIIAQRVASVSDADRIIVLSDGRIDGIGTHDELMATNAIYREVYESQRKGVA